jgi:acetoin utilization protein AcuB
MGPQHAPARQLRVADRMTRDVVSIESEQTCRWALRMMSAGEIARLPVLDGGRLVGVVTETDIRRRVSRMAERSVREAEENLLANVKVGGVMEYFPTTVTPETTIAEATALILAHDVSTLPVVEGGRLIGILTLRDLVETLSEILGGTSPSGAGREIG